MHKLGFVHISQHGFDRTAGLALNAPRLAGRIIDEATRDLVAALGAKGVAARRLVLYDAVPVAELSAEARAALAENAAECAVALFSPRSAALFFAQVVRAGLEEQLSAATLLAFSDAVAAAAIPDRWKTVKIAPARTLDAMAALIRA